MFSLLFIQTFQYCSVGNKKQHGLYEIQMAKNQQHFFYQTVLCLKDVNLSLNQAFLISSRSSDLYSVTASEMITKKKPYQGALTFHSSSKTFTGWKRDQTWASWILDSAFASRSPVSVLKNRTGEVRVLMVFVENELHHSATTAQNTDDIFVCLNQMNVGYMHCSK